MFNLTSNDLQLYINKIALMIVMLAIVVFAWANLFMVNNFYAHAATVDGIGDRIEGKVTQDIGTVERNLGKVTGQAEGALKQAQGKAKEDIGSTKNQLDNVQDNLENSSESFIDSVKDFLN